MANFNALLRQEVSRLARKETRAQLKQLKSASAAYRRAIAALRRDVAAQARELAALRRTQPRTTAVPAATSERPTRFRADGVAAHRKRLGLSAEQFGRLVGVTGQTIYNWEKGKRPRPAQLAALASVRTLGRREAKARLGQLGKAKKPARANERPVARRTRRRGKR